MVWQSWESDAETHEYNLLPKVNRPVSVVADLIGAVFYWTETTQPITFATPPSGTASPDHIGHLIGQPAMQEKSPSKHSLPLKDGPVSRSHLPTTTAG